VKLDRICRDKLRRTHSDDKVFNGPAGAGKSCLLYSMAQYAVQNGFIVLYIANSKVLIIKTDA